MRGVLSIYYSFLGKDSLKKNLRYKLSFLIIIINLTIGGFLLSTILYGVNYALAGIAATLIPGLLFIFFTAFLTHLILKFFSQKSFEHTLSSYAMATIPAILSWIPFVYFIAVILSLFVLIKGLSLQHHIKWYKALFSLIIVAAISYLLMLFLGYLLGGSA